MEEVKSAIVLAGGKSKRLGQDKAMIDFRGMTLLEHVLVALMPMIDRIVVVADVANKYSLPCGRVIADNYPDSGPVGGILTGLTTLGPGFHLVVACDMPTLQPGVLQLLSKAATLDWDAIVPTIDGRPEPLCAVYSHLAAPKLMHFLESDRRSAREALNSLHVKWVGEGVLRRIDPLLRNFTNVNTPQDLAALESLPK